MANASPNHSFYAANPPGSLLMDAQSLTHNLGGCWRNGHGQAPCPVCQPERRRDQNALSISIGTGRLLLHCFKSRCNIADISEAANTPLAAVQVDPAARQEHVRKQAEYQAAKLEMARSLWDAANPIAGTKAEAYLRQRRITIPLPASLRFVPDLHHGPTESLCCAMVADVRLTGGVHRTFFTKQGKRVSKSAKMMLGPCKGGAVRLSESDGPLVVCEGIETGLSLLSGLLRRPVTVWAALSTSGMKALHLPDNPGELLIATDSDDAGAGTVAGNILAHSAYTLGWNVWLMPAPDGMDWNDALQSGVSV
ncbi:toprim domain-containing protein [Leisingera sp. JC11]|uniref:DUF7146 domain-containing protein n=1 Tax=Leisingera sp. JC11 TaxID=3042469 RepID=UPI003452A7E7